MGRDRSSWYSLVSKICQHLLDAYVEYEKEVKDGPWCGVLASAWPSGRGDASLQRLDAGC